MNWKCKIYSLFCIAAICIIFASSHIYSDYDILLEADFISHGLKFEAADLENLVVDKPKILDFASNTPSILRPLGSDLLGQAANSYLQVATSYQTTSPLRC